VRLLLRQATRQEPAFGCCHLHVFDLHARTDPRLLAAAVGVQGFGNATAETGKRRSVLGCVRPDPLAAQRELAAWCWC
jgi:hypothetical protein